MDVVRAPAEVRFAAELAALTLDPSPRPRGWLRSGRAVVDFVLGRDAPLETPDGHVTIRRKFEGDDALVRRVVAALAADQAVLLVGEPGTAKSWLSELLAAAICGDSLTTVTGSAGLAEEAVRYTWNYALLLAEGPSPRALVPGPLVRALRSGSVLRFEELTRAQPEVQDVLLSALSERVVFVPELGGGDGVVFARPGFQVLATANTRDRGVHELSAALRRRFHVVEVRPIVAYERELAVVRDALRDRPPVQAERHDFPEGVLGLLVTAFRELRQGMSADGVALPRPTATLSTAETVDAAVSMAVHAALFDRGVVDARHVAQALADQMSAPEDRRALDAWFELVVRPRAEADRPSWSALWAARR